MSYVIQGIEAICSLTDDHARLFFGDVEYHLLMTEDAARKDVQTS